MKKNLFILLVLMSVQVFGQQKFGLGLKIGQNFSTVDNVSVDHNSASYHAGVTTYIGINSKFSIAVDAILSQTKLEASPSAADLIAHPSFKPETYHLNYLSIPLLLQFHPVKSFTFQAGPQYSVLLDQKKDGIENARVAFSSGEFSMVGGAKLDLGGFFIYGRYAIGLNNIGSTQQLLDDLKNQDSWKTRQWQLGVGLNLFNF
ncbi:MAG: outer membrane beta-barrel protein [Chitinophagia bacterium]|jgi:Outer membrane protein beta-barrel domain